MNKRNGKVYEVFESASSPTTERFDFEELLKTIQFDIGISNEKGAVLRFCAGSPSWCQALIPPE